MDTIRTCYIDSHNAKERNGSYVYDLVGGISVPEGARVFIDNVSFAKANLLHRKASLHAWIERRVGFEIGAHTEQKKNFIRIQVFLRRNDGEFVEGVMVRPHQSSD